MSPELLAHVKHSEGLRLEPYRDPVGLWTCGYGHLMNRPPKPGERWTMEQAEQTLAADLGQAQTDAMLLCPDLIGARLDALTDLVFNLGATKLRNTGVIVALNAGEWQNAADRYRRWNKGRIGGQLVELPGLTTRRNALAPWIETGNYS